MFTQLHEFDSASPEDRAEALEIYERVLMRIFGSEQEVLKYYDRYLDVCYGGNVDPDEGREIRKKWERADRVAHLEAEDVWPLGMPDGAHFDILDQALEELD